MCVGHIGYIYYRPRRLSALSSGLHVFSRVTLSFHHDRSPLSRKPTRQDRPERSKPGYTYAIPPMKFPMRCACIDAGLDCKRTEVEFGYVVGRCGWSGKMHNIHVTTLA